MQIDTNVLIALASALSVVVAALITVHSPIPRWAKKAQGLANLYWSLPTENRTSDDESSVKALSDEIYQCIEHGLRYQNGDMNVKKPWWIECRGLIIYMSFWEVAGACLSIIENSWALFAAATFGVIAGNVLGFVITRDW